MTINKEPVMEYLGRFKYYIEYKSGKPLDASNPLSNNLFFMDKNQEGYKETVYEEAQRALGFNSWINENLSDNEIIARAERALSKSQNLVFLHQKRHFKNKNENTSKAAGLLREIYCNENYEKAFGDAVAFWGGKYDLIAYLFFIKDKNRYLPISPKNFDEKFRELGIDLKTSCKCSPQNYISFIECIDELRVLMEDYFGCKISLLGAHSVIWMMGSVKEFYSQVDEINADATLAHDVNNVQSCEDVSFVEDFENPTQRAQPIIENGHKIYPRKREVALKAMKNADYCCELNPQHESFVRKNSNTKYMEPHHLIPMSQSEHFEYTLDTPSNIICLCSNCHNEIHYGKNSEYLIEKLFVDRKERLERAKIPISFERLKKMYR